MKLRELLEKATPGFYKAFHDTPPNKWQIIRTASSVKSKEYKVIASLMAREDAKLITALRNCASELLDVVDTLEKISDLAAGTDHDYIEKIADVSLAALKEAVEKEV